MIRSKFSRSFMWNELFNQYCVLREIQFASASISHVVNSVFLPAIIIAQLERELKKFIVVQRRAEGNKAFLIQLQLFHNFPMYQCFSLPPAHNKLMCYTKRERMATISFSYDKFRTFSSSGLSK